MEISSLAYSTPQNDSREARTVHVGTKLAVDSSSKHETTHSPWEILMKKMLFAAAGLVIALALAC